MISKKKLQQEIECARAELDRALEANESFEAYYSKSVRLDGLIEKYIDYCEQNEN